jgi:hypothetical protein
MGGLSGKEDITAADFYGQRDEFGGEVNQKGGKGKNGKGEKGSINKIHPKPSKLQD